MRVKLSEILRLLEEGPGAPYGVAYLGTFARPGDGRAGLAYGRPPLSRLKKFPYDRDDPDNQYGMPGNIPDRGNAGHRPDHKPGGPVPSNTGHSEWDIARGVHSKESGFEEASGTPMNFTMSGRGGMATNVPGASGARGWGGSPTKPWDDDENADELEKYGKTDEAALTAPARREPPPFADGIPVEPIPNQDPEHWADTSDQGLEHLLSRIGKEPDMHPDEPEHEPEPADQYSEFPSVLMAVKSEPAFQNGLGRGMVPGRGFQTGWTETYDLMVPEDMVWETIAKMLGIG